MNILITSVGRRAYIVNYFKEALAGRGKVFACNSSFTIGMKAADGGFIAPQIYSDEYIPSLIEFSKANDVAAVLSLFDIDLLVLARNEQAFEEAGIKLILAPAEFVLKCNDKYETCRFAADLGLRAPKTYLSVEETKRALASGDISYPVVIKPRWGMASMSVYMVYDEAELDVFAKRARREIMESYLKFESSFTKEAMLVFQEKLVGKEYGLDVINDLEGNYLGVFPKQKVTMRSGETDIGLTVDPAPFDAFARTIAAASKHKGILSVDCFMTEQGLVLLEMNCRISGHYPIAHEAGLNYVRMLVAWLEDREPEADCFAFRPNVQVTKDLVPVVLLDESKNEDGGL